MSYIHAVQVDNGQTSLIEPLLFATASGTSSAIIANINNFELIAGAYVHIKVGTVDAHATLNVNGTGAKDIYYKNVQINADTLTENNIYTFVYDGVHWVVVGDIAGKNIIVKTTAQWQTLYNQKLPAGTIMVYSDHGTITETISGEEVTKTVPGIKISDGSTFIIDLPFVGDDVAQAIRSELADHINDNIRHITAEERAFWNNKINCNDTVNQHVLILTRN